MFPFSELLVNDWTVDVFTFILFRIFLYIMCILYFSGIFGVL